MQEATPTPNEKQRLEALYRLGILDTPSEERFDRVTRIARQLFSVPIALVSLVDRERQWFKSKQGLDACETGRDISFCGHAIKSEELFVIEDTLQDERFSDNPLVIGAPHIRFYAGCPIKAPGGEVIGTLCLIDTRPRSLSDREYECLRDLGMQVESELRINSEPTGIFLLDRFPNLVSSPVASAIISVLLFSFMAWGIVQYDRTYLEALRAEDEKEVVSKLSLVRGNLESALNAKLALVNGPAGMIHATGVANQEAFSRFAAQIGRNVSGVSSLQLAPDGIVTYVWPLETNKAAIGHNLLGDPDRAEAARRAIESRSTWIAGPLDLIQGGTALIARQPIFLPEPSGGDRFWGFSTLLLDLDLLYEEAGLNEAGGDIQLAIRGKDAKGSRGEKFYGADDFEWNKAVMAEVSLPSGSWQMAAMPRGGWAAHYKERQRLIAVLGFTSLLLACLFYIILRMPQSMRRMIRSANAALERSETRFRDAIEAAPSGFVVFDQHGQLAFNNQNFDSLYRSASRSITPGIHYRAFVEETIAAGIYREAPESSDSLAEDLYSLLGEAHTSLEIQLADGKWINILYHPMRDGGWVGFHRDITELRDNQAQLVREKIRAEEASKTKTDFLATVSHEVRTPLNGVLGMLGVLQESSGLSEEQDNYIRTAYRSAQHLLTILNEILDISKIEAGKLLLEPEVFNVAEMLSETSELLAANAQEKGLALRLDCAEDLESLVVSADQGRLRQVILNLLSNAIKFTSEGSVILSAESSHSGDREVSLTIKVSDTGVGFSDADIEKLFEPFTQLQTRADRQYGGTGIGLPICRRIIEAMGGSLTAHGESGKGACFTVNVNLPIAELAPPGNNRSEGDLPLLPKDRGTTLRLLLAEDGETNRIVVQAMLKDSGYQIDVAHDGQEAVDAVSRFPYDVVLMDVYMPNMDGLEATRRIRALERGKDIPIIALTANAMDGDREKFIDTGMTDYLPKPVKKNDLLAALARATVTLNSL